MKPLFTFVRSNAKPLAILFGTWGVYFLFFWPKMLYFNTEGDLTAGWRNIWGDWALHITQANAFHYQPILHTLSNHPVYAGATLSYPFVVNLLSGFLLRLGLSIPSTFIIPSIIFSLVLLIGLFLLGKRLIENSTQVLLAITIFFTSGGLGFFYYFFDLQNKFSFERLLYPPHEYTHMKDIGYYWTTTLLAHLVPQRAFLLGMTVGVLLLATLYQRFKNNFSKISLKQMLTLGLATGLLSYIHSHTLIVFFIISAWLLLFDLKHYKHWLTFALGTALTALPFFILFPGPALTDYISFLPGWLSHKKELDIPFWWFWIKNWGLLLPLFIFSMLKLDYPKKLQQFISAFVILFFLGNLFIFQPSSWDNAKLFLWIYLIFAFPVAELLSKIWQKHWIGKLAASLLFLILIASGSLDLIRVLNTSKESFVMISKQEIELADFLRTHSSYFDIVLTSDNHLHWVPVMSGRQIVMGYRGWLWSHGFDYKQKEEDIREIFQGGPRVHELLEKYQISFVVTDDKTRTDFNSNDAFFSKNFELFMTSPKYNVYRTR